MTETKTTTFDEVDQGDLKVNGFWSLCKSGVYKHAITMEGDSFLR